MNDNRKFLGMKTQLIDLLTIGMPLVIISTYLQITSTTCLRYIKTLRGSGEWNKENVTFLKSVKDVLKIFTLIERRQMTIEGMELKRLQAVIEQSLQFQRITEILKISINSIYKLTLSEFSPAMPNGYQDFIRALYNERDKKYILRNGEEKSILFHYLASEKDFEIGVTIDTWFYPLIDNIISEHARDLRNSINPTFKVNVIERVEYLLSTLFEREAMILKKYFGLGFEKNSLEEIAHETGLVSERVRQIKERALRRCRASERMKMLFNPIPPPLPLTKTPIKLFDFSVRALNVLRDADIETLEQLLEYKKMDLIKFRNMGKRTMTEIEEMLESLNLKFRE